MINKTNILTIRTPEGVSFPLHLAGPATRCLAWSVDLAVILLLQNIISYSVMFLNIFSPSMAQAFGIILYFVITIFYGIVLEWIWNGKTLGKKVCKLQVVDAEGLRLTLPQVVIRNLMRAIDIIPAFYLIGGVTSLLSPRYQRLGDIAAQTLVIRNIKVGKPDITTLMPDKYNSLRDYPYIVSRLQNNCPVELSSLLLKALIRRNLLKIEARREIYSQIVQELAKCAKFPQEATDGLSNERYLKNCVDILYTKN